VDVQRVTTCLSESQGGGKQGKNWIGAIPDPKFTLSVPSRPPDQSEAFLLGEQTVALQAWHRLHLKKLTGLVGTVLQIEFLRPNGTLCYKQPRWL